MDLEHVVERVGRVIHLVEPGRGAGDQDDPGLGLEDLAEPPPGVPVRHVPEEHVEVLDEQHQPPVFPVRETEERAQAPIRERAVVQVAAQGFGGAAQVRVVRTARRLVGELGEALQPELSGLGNLVAFFGEDHGEEASGQLRIAAHFRRHPQQQGGLAAPPRPDDDLRLIGGPGAAAQRVEEGFELELTDAEHVHQLRVREKPRVVLADRPRRQRGTSHFERHGFSLSPTDSLAT